MPEQFKYSYRVQPLNLAGGLTNLELPVHGEKIVYASPTDGPEVSIRLQALNNDAIPLRPEGEIVAPFTRIFVTAADTATTVYLLIATPKDIHLLNRAASGGGGGGSSVRPLEEEVFLAKQMYRRSGTVTGTAANNGHAQVFNPVGSGKTVRVLAVGHTPTGTNMRAHLGHYNTPLATLVGNLLNIDNTIGNSAAEIRTGYNVGILVTPMHELGNVMNTRQEEQFLAILAPGYGFCLACDLVNMAFNYSFTIQEF